MSIQTTLRNAETIHTHHPHAQITHSTGQSSHCPTIGMFLGDIREYYFMLWSGVADEAQAQQVNLLGFVGDFLQSSEGVKVQGNIIYDLANTETIDGLILVSNIGKYVSLEEFKVFCHRYVPLPIVNVLGSLPQIPSVVIDNETAWRALITHLIADHGYQRVAFIKGPNNNYEAQQRYRVYTEVLHSYRLSLDPALVVLGDFTPESGLVAAQELLSRSVDFDAVVASNDYMALSAMHLFRERGIRVPEQVAVVGFDDLPASQYNLPPLSTIRQPIPELGRRAVELLLAQLRHEAIPEVITLPTTMVIRQSCGCPSHSILQANAERASSTIRVMPERSFTSFDASQRAEILATITPLCSDTIGNVMIRAEDIDRLLDALVKDIQEMSGDTFVSTFKDILTQSILAGDDIMGWQQVLSLLRRAMLPHLKSLSGWVRAENLWQQGRVMYENMAQQAQMLQRIQEEHLQSTLHDINQLLSTAFDIAQLMDILALELPRLNIQSSYLCLYEQNQESADSERLPAWSRLILAIAHQERIAIEGHGHQQFSSQQLLPERFWPQTKRYEMLVMPLYFQAQQLGFILFEKCPRNTQDSNIYQTLQRQICTALQGALLMQRVQEHSAEITRQKYILDTFMANVPDSIYFKDRTSAFTKINNALAVLLGLDNPDDAFGKTDFDFFPENSARAKYEQEQEIIRTGQPLLEIEEPVTGGRWALTTKMPLRDEHGTIIGTFGISRDITPLKQVETFLRKLEKAMETTEVGITITDNNGRIVYVNPAEAQMHGYTVDEILGQYANMFAPPEFREPPGSADAEPGAFSYWRRERTNMRKDGTIFPVRLISNPITDPEGHPLGKVTVCEDITERKQAEQALLAAHEELKEKNAQLAELNASKDKFFSIISHDLRSPFTVMLAFSQLIDENTDRYSKEEIKTKVSRLRTSAEQLYALLENLLTWSRIQRGAMEYDPENVDLEEIVEDNIDLFASKAEDKQITLKHSITQETIVYADFNMVNTVLRNLISNAIKFTPSGGAIDVFAQPHDEQFLEVAVADTGMGIREEDLSKLFRIDVQYVNAGTAGEKGTGLGLNLCKDLVEKNGGVIWVESEVGKGSTFKFTLLKLPVM